MFQKWIGTISIIRTAAKEHTSPASVRQEIQQVIDIAWTTDDPKAKDLQQKLFPAGKPTPEEFIAGISQYAKECINT